MKTVNLKGTDMEKIHYIQKEEEQMGTHTTFCPIFYKDYDDAEKEFLKYIKSEKENLTYISHEFEGVDLIVIDGCDEWGDVRKTICLRSGEIV